VDDAPLAGLVGQELDSVSFVRDYIELRIDYSILRALGPVAGLIGGIRWRLDDEHGADLLRRYIGRAVTTAEIIENERISLVFGSDDRIDLSLKPEDRVGPEAAHFVPARKDGRPDTAAMWIW
jgi:hypothetical protein